MTMVTTGAASRTMVLDDDHCHCIPTTSITTSIIMRRWWCSSGTQQVPPPTATTTTDDDDGMHCLPHWQCSEGLTAEGESDWNEVVISVSSTIAAAKWINCILLDTAWLRNIVYVVLYWSHSKWQWKPINVMIGAKEAMSLYIVLVAYIATLLHDGIHIYMSGYGNYGVL